MTTPAISRRIDQRLAELYESHRRLERGSVAQYYTSGIGYTAAAPGEGVREPFGIAVCTLDGEVHPVGDHDQPFALQSISKVFTYALALEDHERATVLRRVGVEPTGDRFNAIAFGEHRTRASNPMVNTGALVTASLILGDTLEERVERIVGSMRLHAGHDRLGCDPETLALELASADRNRAVAYLLRSEGALSGDVEELVRLYLSACSVRVTCEDLAVMAATLANGGVNPITRERAPKPRRLRDVLSVMYTCGMYDFAGEWAFEVGVPAKSGVSGGIMAVIPGKLGIGVYSPGLDAHGNSVRGVEVCREISQRLGLHLLAAEAEDALTTPASSAGPGAAALS